MQRKVHGTGATVVRNAAAELANAAFHHASWAADTTFVIIDMPHMMTWEGALLQRKVQGAVATAVRFAAAELANAAFHDAAWAAETTFATIAVAFAAAAHLALGPSLTYQPLRR